MKQPNIIYIMMDDMGFGDTECYGPSLMNTPNMKRIADEGVTFTRAYTAPTCSPARAQVLTGCYAQRVGISRVLFPNDKIGLTDKYPTVAKYLGDLGYATTCIGKWHLGAREEHFPTRNGFDEFYGLLYSNDMAPLHIYRNEEVEEEKVDQASLTRRYAEEAGDFIERNRDRPFFCYLANTMPHVPLFVEEEFDGKSACGLYGDTIECIDHYIGKIIDKLEECGLADTTLIIVTSDNGPWFEGSPGGTRGRKFDVYEGGIKVPFFARWPEQIAAGTRCDEVVHLMDMLPTFVSMAGGDVPADIDGLDIGGVLTEKAKSPHDCIFLYHGNELKGVIRDRWKLHLKCQRGEYMSEKEYPKLHDIVDDPDESYSLAMRHPEVVKELVARIEAFNEELRPFYVERARGE